MTTPNPKGSGIRFVGMGVELVGAVVGFCLLGIWIDYRYATSPKGVLICAGLGLVGGLYNFIRQALRAVKETAPPPPSGQRDEKNAGSD